MLKRSAMLSLLLAAALGGPLHAETADEFFKGKQITLVVGYNPGGPYDVYARFAAVALPSWRRPAAWRREVPLHALRSLHR